jgi:ribonuclease T
LAARTCDERRSTADARPLPRLPARGRGRRNRRVQCGHRRAARDCRRLDRHCIDPYHPLRIASTEGDALGAIFGEVRRAVREQQCTRAILVGHNAHFDLGFLNAAVARAGIRRNPFHPFSCFDTVTLAGIAYGQTVLSRAAQAAGLAWDSGEAHSAAYDAERTADLFCLVCNQFQPIYEVAARRLASEPSVEPPGEPSNPLLEPAPE